jgi:hypothetical protein
VVTKKKRRSQLARAAAVRRQEHRAQREARRRRVRMLVTGLLVLAVVVGLAAWIATHRDTGNTAGAHGDYDAVARHDIPTATAEVTR